MPGMPGWLVNVRNGAAHRPGRAGGSQGPALLKRPTIGQWEVRRHAVPMGASGQIAPTGPASPRGARAVQLGFVPSQIPLDVLRCRRRVSRQTPVMVLASRSGKHATRPTMLAEFWRLLKAAFDGWWADRAMSLGASIAFFTVFYLAPMLLAAIAVADLSLVEKRLRAPSLRNSAALWVRPEPRRSRP